MLDYLEQLRKKPLYYRKRVAVVGSTAISVIILLIWLSTFNFGMMANIIDSKAIAKELKPLQPIKARVADFFTSVKEMSSAFFEVATSSVKSVAPVSKINAEISSE